MCAVVSMFFSKEMRVVRNKKKDKHASYKCAGPLVLSL